MHAAARWPSKMRLWGRGLNRWTCAAAGPGCTFHAGRVYDAGGSWCPAATVVSGGVAVQIASGCKVGQLHLYNNCVQATAGGTVVLGTGRVAFARRA